MVLQTFTLVLMRNGERNHQRNVRISGENLLEAERDAQAGTIIHIVPQRIIRASCKGIPVSEVVALIRRAQPPVDKIFTGQHLKPNATLCL